MTQLETQSAFTAPQPDVQTKTVQTVRIGDLELCEDTQRAAWRGQVVELTLSEYRIVTRLALASGRDLTHRQLYDAVRPNGFLAGDGPEGYRANVRTFIKRIREKFRGLDPDFNHIQVYRGFGYAWRPRS